MIPPINLQEMTINIGLISSGGDTIPRFTTSVIARQLESVTLKFISSVAVGNWYITISVAFFFILEVGGSILEQILKYFKTFSMFLIENHWRHQSVRSFMANDCRKHFLLPWHVLWAFLHPSIDPRLRLDGPQCKNSSCWMPSSFSAQDSGLKPHALLLSLNVLMLHGNMEQLTKLHTPIFALLTWTNVVMTL